MNTAATAPTIASSPAPHGSSPGRSWSRLCSIAFAAGLALLFSSGRAAELYDFNLPAGDLEASLRAFSGQCDVQVIVSADLARGVRTSSVDGRLAPQEALNRMLRKTELRAVTDEASGAFALVRRPKPAHPTPQLNAAAIIVVGLAVDDRQASRFWTAADTAQEGLIARGVPSEAITLIPATRNGKSRRDSFVAAASAVKPQTDETWVLLIGNTGVGRDGGPSFQVSGPRISAADLAAAVKALPGRRYLMVAAPRGAGYLEPLLDTANLEAVAATAAGGELNEPRFTGIWANLLAAHPDADFRTLAIDAAAETRAYYSDHELAEPEHVHLLDRSTHKIIEAPSTAR